VREGKTRYVILGLLSERPMSGYMVKKLVDARFRFFWSESYGQLYPELKALLREGLVEIDDDAALRPEEPVPTPSTAGRRDRIAYRIAPAGREALRRWLDRPAERESVRFEILLKMYFAGQGDRKALQASLREFEAHYATERATLDRYQEELERIPDERGDHRDVLRVIDFGQKSYDAYLAWCRGTFAEWEGR